MRVGRHMREMRKTIFVGVSIGTKRLAMVPIECCDVCTHPCTAEADTLTMVRKWCGSVADWKGVSVHIIGVTDWMHLQEAHKDLERALDLRCEYNVDHAIMLIRKATAKNVCEIPEPIIRGWPRESEPRSQSEGCACRRTFVEWQDLFSITPTSENVLSKRLWEAAHAYWDALAESMSADEHSRFYGVNEFSPEPIIREMSEREKRDAALKDALKVLAEHAAASGATHETQ